MIFSRPVGVWLVLIFIAWGTLGTMQKLSVAFAAGTSFGLFHTAFSLAIVGLGGWLFAEVWTEGKRQILVTRLNIALFATYYGLIALSAFQNRGQDSGIAALVLGAVMCLIWAAIHWYLSRKASKKAES